MIESKIKRVQKGFTLMEILVSLAILAMSTISILGMSAYSAKIEKQSEVRSAALFIARTQIDNLLSISQSNRAVVSDEDLPIPADLLASMPGDDVSAKYSILPVAGSKNLQTLSVTVQWRNTAGHGPMSQITATKIVSTVQDMSEVSTDGWNNPPIDQLFYTPPPPPPPTSTSGGTTGGTSSSTTGGSTGSSTTTTGGGSGGTTGSSTGGGTTGGPPAYTGYIPKGGNKWK
jgi:prepilin-type N-terminal cleavage/methylation domain-containing protein